MFSTIPNFSGGVKGVMKSEFPYHPTIVLTWKIIAIILNGITQYNLQSCKLLDTGWLSNFALLTNESFWISIIWDTGVYTVPGSLGGVFIELINREQNEHRCHYLIEIVQNHYRWGFLNSFLYHTFKVLIWHRL